MGEGFEAIVNECDFGRTNDPSLLIDPNAGGNVDEAVELGDEMLLVNKNRAIGIGGRDPFAGVADSAGILSDAQDFKIFIVEFFVEDLPPGQVKAAASPRGPGNDENFLAAEICERVLLAVHIGQSEIGRL
jgi:hypothetical protein